MKLATARAGNVIGGGDWAAERIVPDCARAWATHKELLIRSPSSTRPWQHVLEPLSGYLLLGAKLEEARSKKNATEIARFAQAFNFGPTEPHQVREIVDLLRGLMHREDLEPVLLDEVRAEIHDQYLSSAKAAKLLNWSPRFTLKEGLIESVDWYRHFFDSSVAA